MKIDTSNVGGDSGAICEVSRGVPFGGDLRYRDARFCDGGRETWLRRRIRRRSRILLPIGGEC